MVSSQMDTYSCQFLLCCLDIDSHSLHVIIDPVQHCPLIYHHILQVLEDFREFNNAVGDVVNLTLALGNDCIVALETLLCSLLKR